MSWARCGGEPMPVDANGMAPGFCLASATRSLTDLMPSLGETTNTSETLVTRETGAKSRNVSNGMFAMMCGDTVTAPAVVRNSE